MLQTLHLWILGAGLLFITVTFAQPKEGEFWKQVPGLVECVPRPRPYKIADNSQCDKYYICNNGIAIPQLCEDGTVFDFGIQNCVLLNGADCKGRPLLQESLKKEKCPRKTGLFPHEDPSMCDRYYQCLHGNPTLIKCPDMLLFDRTRGVCDYADLADTSSCQLAPSSVVCPSGKRDSSSLSDLDHRFIPHPTDCRRFFFCATKIPRPLACEENLAFDLKTLSCINKSLVPRCSN